MENLKRPRGSSHLGEVGLEEESPEVAGHLPEDKGRREVTERSQLPGLRSKVPQRLGNNLCK